MQVIVDDKVTAVLDPKVEVTIEAPSYRARSGAEKKTVSVDDTYQVIPASKRITADYVVPDYILSDLQGHLDDLRADMLQEMGDRDVAVINESKTYTDEEDQRTLTTVKADYISNSGMPGQDTGPAFILKDEIASLQIKYDTGSGLTTASFQDMNDTIVNVDGNQAGFTTALQANVNNTSANATNIIKLEAIVGDSGVSIDDLQAVQAGQFLNWYGPTTEYPAPVIGMVKYVSLTGTLRTSKGAVTVTDKQYQFLGGTLGAGNDGWVLVTGAGDTDAGWSAGTSRLVSGSDGSITGWSFGDGSALSSEFKIQADKFTISSSNNKHTPFTIAPDPDNPGEYLSKFEGTVQADKIRAGALVLDNLDVGGAVLNGTVIDKDGISVYDNGQLKVRIGKLI